LHRYGPDSYPGGLLWLNAEVPEDRLEAQLHGILRLLRPEVPELLVFRESGRLAARDLGEALRELVVKKPVHYVVDNVPEPEAGGQPQDVSRWCPTPGQVSLLLTSRASQSLVAEVRRLEVRELASEAAVRLSSAGQSGFATDTVASVPAAVVSQFTRQPARTVPP
jgi:hypothetical protein